MKNNITTLLAVETFISSHQKDLRNNKILLDTDIANLYEISIEKLHRTVKNNIERFPPDFMFLLNEKEKKRLLLTRKKVYAFTYAGIMMLGGQLKSSRAIKTHMQLIDFLVGKTPGKIFEILSDMQSGENKL